MKEGEDGGFNPFGTDTEEQIIDSQEEAQSEDVVSAAIEQLPEQEQVTQPEPEPEQKPVERERKALSLSESKTERGNARFTPDWEGREITLGLPWVHEASKRTLISLLALAVDCGKERLRIDWEFWQDTVHDAKNAICARFLSENESQWLFMLGELYTPAVGRAGVLRGLFPERAKAFSDTTLERHVLRRLFAAGKTVVGALVGSPRNGFLKTDTEINADTAYSLPNQVRQVRWTSSDCMLIHRSALLDIIKTFPSRAIDGKPFQFFTPQPDLTGDEAFCRMAQASGHIPHVDLAIPVF